MSNVHVYLDNEFYTDAKNKDEALKYIQEQFEKGEIAVDSDVFLYNLIGEVELEHREKKNTEQFLVSLIPSK